MKNHLFLYAFAFTIISMTLSAQSLNKKGFVVLNNGDTLHGSIKYKMWDHNPRRISFYLGSNKNPRVYRVSELSYFEITGIEAYKRRTIYNNSNFLSIAPEYVWMRELVKGNTISLYQLNDRENQFYVKEKEADFVKLKYPNRNLKMFIPLLKAYAVKLKADNDVILKKIDNAKYEEEDLIDIVMDLNNYGAEKSTAISLPATTTMPRVKEKYTFFVSAGVGFSTFKLTGRSYLYDLTFEPATMPYLSVGVNIISGGQQKMSYRLEVNYTMVSFEGQTINASRDISYNVKQSSIAPVFSALYRFTKKAPLEILAGAAVASNFSTYGKNQYHQTTPTQDIVIDDYASMHKSWLSSQLKLVAFYKKKIELGGYYQIAGDYTETSSYSFNPRTFVLWVGYHF